MKQLQSPYFSALSPHGINPTTPTQGHFVLSPVSLTSRDQDDGPVELTDRHLQSHGKIGDCEQSRTEHVLSSFPPTRMLAIHKTRRVWRVQLTLTNTTLTKREGCTWEYWPEVMAVRTERSKVHTKTTKGQYFPVWLKLARVVSCLL